MTLKQIPIYYSKYSSLKIEKYSANQIFKILNDILLKISDVYFSYNIDKYKIKCIYWRDGEMCNFNITLYSFSDEIILCEFSRKSGSAIDFNMIYKKILFNMPDDFVDITIKANIKDIMDIYYNKTYLYDKKFYDYNINMAFSEYIDVKKLGIVFLLNFSKFKDYTSINLKNSNKIFEIINNNLESNDTEIITNILNILDNLIILHNFKNKIPISIVIKIYNLKLDESIILKKTNDHLKQIIKNLEFLLDISNTDYTLEDPCLYSFQDLFNINNEKMPINFYDYNRKDINKIVKKLCKKIGWYYKDIKSKDGEIYTSFSKKIRN